MDGNAMSPADIAALQGNDMNGNSWIWFLLIFVLLGWNGNAGRAVPQPNAAERENLALKNEISNNTQTRDILNSLGRFVAYAGSGTAAGTVAAAGN